MQIARDADALLVTYAKITADMIGQLTRCRIISRFGIGVDNVDLAARHGAGIVVTKVPDYCIDEVSDHAMALLLALGAQDPARQRPGARRRLADEGASCRSTACGAACWGWSASAGFRSWSRPRPRPSACGCSPTTRSCRRTSSPRRRRARRVLRTAQHSDYVSIHTPLLPETRGLFNADVFGQMKPTAYL